MWRASPRAADGLQNAHGVVSIRGARNFSANAVPFIRVAPPPIHFSLFSTHPALFSTRAGAIFNDNAPSCARNSPNFTPFHGSPRIERPSPTAMFHAALLFATQQSLAPPALAYRRPRRMCSARLLMGSPPRISPPFSCGRRMRGAERHDLATHSACPPARQLARNGGRFFSFSDRFRVDLRDGALRISLTTSILFYAHG